ncbi:MAG: aminoglycoside phosphotransferase family protein [Bdellovibrio sp.]|nr:aminoglycoside phosphotransferase family protein [Bdellovibrio sp.]
MFDYDAKFDPDILKKSVPKDLVESLIRKWEPNVDVLSIRELSGGYSNSNFFFEGYHGKQVLRIFHKPIHQLKIEVAILKHIQSSELAPQVRFMSQMEGVNFCIVDFIEGQLLSEAWLGLKLSTLEKILIDVGKKLQQVHSFKFKQAGFFGPMLDIENKFEGGAGTGFFNYIIVSLNSDLVRERLGHNLCQKTLKYVCSHEMAFSAVNSQCHLIHSDFNTKNILICPEKAQVNAILDWEFAHSGTPLVEFANFLRFENETTVDVRALLRKGYGEDNELFCHDWRRTGSLLDIASMCGFLNRETLMPRSLNTVREVLLRTVG